MKCALIVAMGKHREIGKDNDLLWKLPRDMKFFKETTQGHTVVMGRKNWESIPEKFRPLPNRKNIVISRNADYKAEGATLITDLKELSQHIEEGQKCFIIGGAQIYQLALEQDMIDEMYVTLVKETFEADTFFPFVNWENWEEEDILEFEKDEKNPYSFIIKKYTR
ncbi:dihydrofolate reductase [Brumimicrobium sp.]|uniref:dihydrofolate reductase n=1 Tax=Brumimicrobium sp. TaxID=2029867 RepID=UPI00261CB152|nr:dihydrofolate reductase [uncultured Brumimicrobium sp.]